MQEEKKEKEIQKYNSKNIHHNKKIPKNKISSIVNRLYTKDLRKREQNKIILTKIYTPTFTPFIYTKQEVSKKNKNKEENNKPQTQRNHYYKEEEDESDNDDVKINYNTNYNKNKLCDDIYEEDEEKNNGRYKRISNSQKNFKKVEKLPKHGSSKKMTKSKKYFDKIGRHSDNEDEDNERIVIENALRNRLFKHKK